MEKRRLQQEVERTLKRVEEGCDLFMSLHNKFMQQQTAKGEAELKKEIKRLQKLRDVIKAWQGNIDIRNKAPLDISRRRVEKCMEAFRQCERELMTKSYSKDGLAAATGGASGEDTPHTQDRHREHVAAALQQLQQQMQTLHADINHQEYKKTNKKDKDKKKNEQLTETYSLHIKKLTHVLRLADEGLLPPAALAAVAAAAEHYTSSSTTNPDALPDASIYDCLAAYEDEATLSEEQSDAHSDAAALC